MQDPYSKALDWLKSLEIPSEFSSIKKSDDDLASTCCRILTLDGLNGIQSLLPEDRQGFYSYIAAYQNERSGIFMAPQSDLETAPHVRALQDYMNTHLALQALDALDRTTPHRLLFMDELGSGKIILQWLDGFQYSGGRLEAEKLMLVLAFLVYRAEIEGDRSAPRIFHSVLDRLDRIQDVRTGLWGAGTTTTTIGAIAGAAGLVPFYQYVRRPLMRRMRMIDTVLDLQDPAGSLETSLREDPWEDLAVIGVLATLTQTVSYRRDDIKKLLMMYRDAIRKLQLSDGGFPRTRGCAAGSDICGDLWTSWLRLLSLAMIEHTYRGDFCKGREWKFTCRPALGYFNRAEAMGDRMREALPLWMRPFSGLSAGECSDPPAISVVVPCYNLGEYLHEAIESVLAQTCQDLEIIIVNDGSTDEFTQLLLAKHSFPKTRIIHQQNRGLPAARNSGIWQARGRFICCLDPDDRIRPLFFEKAFRILENQADVGMVSGYFETFDERDEIFRYPKCELPDLLVYNQAIEPAVFRKEAWEKAGGYCESFSFSGIEDWDLWISILELGFRSEVIPEIQWEYRMRPEQMSEKMYRPEVWTRLIRELAERHEKSYVRHFLEVVPLHGTRWAELRQWANECRKAEGWWMKQSAHWQALAEEREQTVREQQAWINELSSGKEWLEKQSAHWQALAKKAENAIIEQKARIEELDAELQSAGSRSLHMETDRAFLEQKSWIDELEKAKQWWEQESANWKRLAEERDLNILQLKAWIEELETARNWWEQQAANWQNLAEERERVIVEGNPAPERTSD